MCLHEGARGNVDGVFINRLLRTLRPAWVRPWTGNNLVRLIACGGRRELVRRMPEQLRQVLGRGGKTVLMVWADLDDDMRDGEQLKSQFWLEAEQQGIAREAFEQVVFCFAKDRIENWIQYLNTGATNEQEEGPRVRDFQQAVAAARKLAECCAAGHNGQFPPSLAWSCANWRRLVETMRH